MVKSGTLIDASLVAADWRRPHKGEPVAGRSDRDASWNAMPEKPLFGYKMHLAVDQGSGLVRRAILTPGHVSDRAPFCRLVEGDERTGGACPRAGLRPDPGAAKGYGGCWIAKSWPGAGSPTASWPATTGSGRSLPPAPPGSG